jgi:hypothetical protein
MSWPQFQLFQSFPGVQLTSFAPFLLAVVVATYIWHWHVSRFCCLLAEIGKFVNVLLMQYVCEFNRKILI